jgi:hypothetical protein
MTPNKRKANTRKRLKQQEESVLRKAKKKLRKQIIHFLNMNKIRVAGLLMERYKSKFGE